MNRLISLSVLPQKNKKIFSFFLNFPKDLGLSQPPLCQRFITCHDAGGAPCLKGFQGKRVRDFYTFPSPALSQSRVIIHSCRLVGDDAPLTFSPPTALLLHIRGRKDCQSLTSAVFSLSCSSVQHISPAKKLSEENHGAFCLPYLPTFRCKQHVTTHTVILLFFVLFLLKKGPTKLLATSYPAHYFLSFSKSVAATTIAVQKK